MMTSNGAEGLAELSNSSQLYDLVLMDISMPVMDSCKATAQIRNRGLQLLIIAMTAYALKGKWNSAWRSAWMTILPTGEQKITIGNAAKVAYPSPSLLQICK